MIASCQSRSATSLFSKDCQLSVVRGQQLFLALALGLWSLVFVSAGGQEFLEMTNVQGAETTKNKVQRPKTKDQKQRLTTDH